MSRAGGEGEGGRPYPMTHVAVRSTDVEASVEFYRRYARFRVVHDRVDNGTRVVWMSHRTDDPEFVIVLLDMPHEKVREPCSMDHFGFAVRSRDEIDRIADLARSEQRLKLGPMDGGEILGYLVMVRDPSGNTCEFSFGQQIRPAET